MLLIVALAALSSPISQGTNHLGGDRTPEQSTDALPGTTDTWSQWRGATRNGQASGTAWGPDLTPEHLVESWRIADLGPSYSGPVVDGERVFTTETVDKESEVVRAYDRKTGEELWQASWPGAMKVPFFAARNGSWIRSTPAVDEESLYVAGMRDYLVCIDKATGEIRWSVDFVERLGTELPPFGGVCSPLVDSDHVYIQAGTSMIKLEKRTGKIVWRSMAKKADIMSAGSFSSPVFADFHGVLQLVVQSRTELVGVDAQTGDVLWSTPVKAYRGMNILTPTVFQGAVFTTAYGGRSHMFNISNSEGELQVTENWQGRAQGYMTSPVVVDGHGYLFLKNNRFGCIDLTTGESVWTSPPTGDTYWSLAVQGDRILSLSDTGILRLLKASNASFEILSEREISESESWAHVAPAGDQIFIRSQDELISMTWN